MKLTPALLADPPSRTRGARRHHSQDAADRDDDLLRAADQFGLDLVEGFLQDEQLQERTPLVLGSRQDARWEDRFHVRDSEFPRHAVVLGLGPRSKSRNVLVADDALSAAAAAAEPQ